MGNENQSRQFYIISPTKSTWNEFRDKDWRVIIDVGVIRSASDAKSKPRTTPLQYDFFIDKLLLAPVARLLH